MKRLKRSKTLQALEMRVGARPRFNPVFENRLEAFQQFVGGLIDVVNVEPEMIAKLDALFQTSFGKRACIVLNDEGINLELPLNRWASMIAGQAVFGDCLFCDVP